MFLVRIASNRFMKQLDGSIFCIIIKILTNKNLRAWFKDLRPARENIYKTKVSQQINIFVGATLTDRKP